MGGSSSGTGNNFSGSKWKPPNVPLNEEEFKDASKRAQTSDLLPVDEAVNRFYNEAWFNSRSYTMKISKGQLGIILKMVRFNLIHSADFNVIKKDVEEMIIL
jgi:hypothetical protein